MRACRVPQGLLEPAKSRFLSRLRDGRDLASETEDLLSNLDITIFPFTAFDHAGSVTQITYWG